MCYHKFKFFDLYDCINVEVILISKIIFPLFLVHFKLRNGPGGETKTYLRRFALMKSSGRRTTLKYQRKLIISPMKGNPI